MNASRPSTRVVVLLALALTIALAVRGCHSTPTSPRSNDASAAASTTVDETQSRLNPDGIPFGFARTEDGARYAAISFVLAGQRLLSLEPTRVPDAIKSMAAAGSAASQIVQAQQQLDRLRKALAAGTGPMHYLQAVLASRVDAFGTDRARVSVWSVGVLSRVGVARPQAGWSISTFDLVWERGDWRIWSELITPGPTPVPNANASTASAEQFEQALSGFESWRPTK